MFWLINLSFNCFISTLIILTYFSRLWKMSTGSSSTRWGGKAPLDGPFCRCNLRARLRVSTTDDNYKRKFWRCPYWTPGCQHGSGDRFCTFFYWVDDDHCSTCGNVVGHLRDRLRIRSCDFKIEKSELEANLVMERERMEHKSYAISWRKNLRNWRIT